MFIFHGSELGFTLYVDGGMVANVTSKDSTKSFPPGTGRMIIGKLQAHKDQDYASVEVDDIIMWNRAITLSELQALTS